MVLNGTTIGGELHNIPGIEGGIVCGITGSKPQIPEYELVLQRDPDLRSWRSNRLRSSNARELNAAASISATNSTACRAL